MRSFPTVFQFGHKIDDQYIYLITSDLGYRAFEDYKKEFPKMDTGPKDKTTGAYIEVRGSGQGKRYKVYDENGKVIKSGRGSGPRNLPTKDEYLKAKDKYIITEETKKCIEEAESLKIQLDKLANDNWDVERLFVDKQEHRSGC